MTGSTPLRLDVSVEDWPLREPFQISGHLFTGREVVVARVSDGTACGMGEAAGVYYLDDTPAGVAATLEGVRLVVERGLDRQALRGLLPPGGARNALDCALWDLEWQRTGQPAWQLAGLDKPRALPTTFTVGADTPARMADAALRYAGGEWGAKAIKLKLVGDGQDTARVAAVRAALPEVWLGVDANQGFSREGLQAAWDSLLAHRVMLVEQPFPAGHEAWLDGLERPIPVAADESVQSLADIEALCGRFDVVNIKLDKCGGLTEGLEMAHRARALGLGVMVGNMMGTSLSVAPAFLLGQLCDVVDLDGPVFLSRDRDASIRYRDGLVGIEAPSWGGVASAREALRVDPGQD